MVSLSTSMILMRICERYAGSLLSARTGLTAEQRDGEDIEQELQDRIKSLGSELENMAPNMRAVERLGVVQERFKNTQREFDDARDRAKKAKEDFQAVKERRFELFSKAFSHISEEIGPIYKNLTKDKSLPMGGQAYVLH